MKRALSYLGNALVLASIGYLIIKIESHYRELPNMQFDLHSTISLVVAVAFYLISAYCLSYIWVLLLRGGNVILPIKDAYVIVGRSQIGKYLPGNIFHFISRYSLGTHYGIPAEAIILSMSIETALLAITATIITIIGLMGGDIELSWFSHYAAQNSSKYVILTIILGLIVLVLISRRIRGWIKPRLVYLHPGRIAAVMLIYAIVLMLNGALIFILINTIWDVNVSIPWYRYAFGFSCAWLIGFIVPGAPGGIGVREAVIVVLFGREIGGAPAIGLAILLRIITSVSDLITFGFAFWLGRMRNIE